jgi:hypothetical protein
VYYDLVRDKKKITDLQYIPQVGAFARFPPPHKEERFGHAAVVPDQLFTFPPR